MNVGAAGDALELRRQRQPRRPTAAATLERRPTAGSPRPRRPARSTRTRRRRCAATRADDPGDQPRGRHRAPAATRTLDQRGVARPQRDAVRRRRVRVRAAAARADADADADAAPPTARRRRPRRRRRPTADARASTASVVVSRRSGTVLVKRPGQQTRFVGAGRAPVIPDGSDGRRPQGRRRDHVDPEGGRQAEKAKFYDGIFKVTQSRRHHHADAHRDSSRRAPNGRGAAQTKKPKTRKLWGDGKGKFRTKGRYSAATVRGTTLARPGQLPLHADRVAQGSVNVRDNVQAQERSGAQGQALHRPDRAADPTSAGWRSCAAPARCQFDPDAPPPDKPSPLAALALALLWRRGRPSAATFTVNTTTDIAGAAGCTGGRARCATRSAPPTANSTTPTTRSRSPPGRSAQLAARHADRADDATRITIRGAGANSTIIQADVERRAGADGRPATRCRDAARPDAAPRRGDQPASAATCWSQGQATVTLDRVRSPTDGAPQRRRDRDARAPTALTIRQSLIDGNSATGDGARRRRRRALHRGPDGADRGHDRRTRRSPATARATAPAIGDRQQHRPTPSLRGVTLTRNNARRRPARRRRHLLGRRPRPLPGLDRRRQH